MRLLARLLVPVLAAAVLSACSTEDDSLPTVKGEYGSKPVVQIDKGAKPADTLQTEVLSRGEGPVVRRGDLLVADYLGKNFRSRQTFDNSYDRGQPAAFPLKSGPGGVIRAWVNGLTGVPVGSRVLLVAPPKDGYGKDGNPQAGIRGGDSLVFVVDLVARYRPDAPMPENSPVPDLPAGLPTAEGEKDPTLTVPQGAEPPKGAETTVVARGTGREVRKGDLAVVQYSAVSWANQPLASSWQSGPVGVPVAGQQPNPFDLLEGVPVGSRVIFELPAQTGTDASKESVAVVVDVLGAHGQAKDGGS